MKTTIKVRQNKLNLIKETPDERKERIQNSNLRTRVVKSKKGKGSYNRNKFKKENL